MVLVIPDGITHYFVVLTNEKALANMMSARAYSASNTNEETSFFTVRRRRCGAAGNRIENLTASANRGVEAKRTIIGR